MMNYIHTIKNLLGTTAIALMLVGGSMLPIQADAATTVSTVPAVVTGTSVVFNGYVNTGGVSTAVYFSYGTTTSGGTNTTPQTLTTSQSFSSQPVTLAAGTYYVRAVAFPQGSSPVYGSNLSFVVSSSSITVQNIAPVINGSTAILNGFVSSGGQTVQPFFKYGQTSAMNYTMTANFQSGTQSFTTSLPNLAAGTWYAKAFVVSPTGPVYATGSMTFTISGTSNTTTTTFNNDAQDRPTVRAMNFTQHGITTTCWTTTVPGSNNNCSNQTLAANDIVSVAIYYHNTGTVAAQNTAVFMNGGQTLSSASTHSLSGGVKATNATQVTGTASATISSAQTLTFIPGSVKWYPNQSGTATALPNGQSGAELFGNGLVLGNITNGWSTQGSVVLQYRVGQGTVQPQTVYGCTNPLATNYNSAATADNGSCIIGTTTQPILGCTNPTATNYNPNATQEAGTCLFGNTNTNVYGCMTPTATNYNPQATISNGSCIFPVTQVPGCTIPGALNYNPAATQNNGSCNFNSYTPPTPIYGCMQSSALNYNPQATISNGSCTFNNNTYTPPVQIYGCMVPGATNYNPSATQNNGSCIYPTTNTQPTTTTQVIYVNQGGQTTVNTSGSSYVALSIKPDYETVYANDKITFTVTYKNLTNTNLRNTVIRVTPAKEFSIVRTNVGQLSTDGSLMVSLGTLGARESGTILVETQVLRSAVSRDMLVSKATITFTTGAAQLEHSESAYATNTVAGNGSNSNGLVGLALFGEGGFLPDTLLEWLIVILIIGGLVYIARTYVIKQA